MSLEDKVTPLRLFVLRFDVAIEGNGSLRFWPHYLNCICCRNLLNKLVRSYPSNELMSDNFSKYFKNYKITILLYCVCEFMWCYFD